MKIALLQMMIREKAKAANVEHGLGLLEENAKTHDVLVLPEIWTTGYSLGHLKEEADAIDGAVVKEICAIARRNACNIVAGSIPMRRGDRVYNTSLAVDRQGNIIANYSKVHLFGLFDEGRFFAPGEGCVSYDLDGEPCSTAICYDLRFPEMFRYLALQGAKLIFVPAEWPVPRGDVWRLLAQARAVENHIFICAVNCVGAFKGEDFYGHSLLVAPSGKILAEGGATECVLSVEIDLCEIERVRKKINALNDVRTELFQTK